MNYGSGGIGFTNNAASGGGPPFPATAANNGLSVDVGTGKIVLGNDLGDTLAQLLSDREIPTNQQEIYFRGGVNEYVAIRGTTSGAPAMLVDVRIDRNANANTFLGQNVNAGASALTFSQLYNDAFRGLTYGVTSSAYAFGDYPTNQVLIYANDTVAGGASLALMANAGFYFMPAGQLINDATVRIYQTGQMALYPGGATPVNNGLQLQVYGNMSLGVTGSGFGLVQPDGGVFRVFTPGTAGVVQVLNSGGADGVTINGQNNRIQTVGGGEITIGGAGVSTVAPSGAAGIWRLGSVIAAASVLDATKYVEISIGGVVVKLATIT